VQKNLTTARRCRNQNVARPSWPCARAGRPCHRGHRVHREEQKYSSLWSPCPLWCIFSSLPTTKLTARATESFILVAAKGRAVGIWDGKLRRNVPKRGRGCTLKPAGDVNMRMPIDSILWTGCRFLPRADSRQKYRRQWVNLILQMPVCLAEGSVSRRIESPLHQTNPLPYRRKP
jgi:hypothetical protein